MLDLDYKLNCVKKLKAGYKVLIMGNHDAGASNYKRIVKKDFSEVTFEEEVQPVVQPECEKKTRKGRAIKVTLITGEVREYASAAEARRDLKIKHANAITAYWMKGHSLKAMNAAGIADIQYAD